MTDNDQAAALVVIPDDNRTPDDPAQTGGQTFTQADVDRIVNDRLGRLKARYSDYDELKRKAAAAMTDQERAAAEAEARGRQAERATVGSRLVRAEIKAAAAGKVDPDVLAAYLEDADLTRFIGEDGEPDAKAIKTRIDRLAGAGNRPASFDGGARTTARPPDDMNALIRRAAGIG